MSETTDTDGEDLREVLGMSAKRAPPRLLAGQVIDDAYRIDGELGEGGMGRVYRAHDLRLGRDVALKLHAGARAVDDDTLRKEAAALAKLAHPNVVTVFEVGAWHGHHWVAMEYVPGGTARTWCAGKTTREVIALYAAAGRGLAAAHAAGLVHRDFKPDNVLVGDDGRPRVADFGLALAAKDAAAIGEGGRGTPGYMPPEQRTGAAIGPAADQYAFAVALWEALAGEKPRRVHTPVGAVRAAGASPKLGERRADEGATTVVLPGEAPGGVTAPRAGAMPRHVEAALRRALADDPAHRWPGMHALLAELARDPARTRRRVAVMAAAGLALAAAGFAASRVIGKDEKVTCEVAWEPAAVHAEERATKKIDAWVADWRVQRREACEAAPPLRDLREACLDRARAELGATLAVLPVTEPNAAMELVANLPRLRACADVAELAGGAASETAPAAVAEVAAATALTARARALRIAGRLPAALAAAEQATAYADAIGLPGPRARARIELATSQIANGHLEGTIEVFEEAARRAAEAKDDALVVTAWLALLDAIGVRHERPEEAERYVVVAEAAIARAGETPARRAELQEIRGDLLVAREKWAEALPLLVDAAKLEAQADGPDEPDLARVDNRIATVLTNLHRGAEARSYLDRAVALIEKAYGSTHPNLGVVLTTRGALELELGDLQASVEDLQRALKIKETALGADHATLAPTLFNLSLALSATGEHGEALVLAKRATAIAVRTLPPGHPRLAFAYSTLGSMEYYAQDYAAAAKDLEAARAILEATGGTTLAQTYRMLGDVTIKQGALKQARAYADRAVALGGETMEGARDRSSRAWIRAAAKDRTGARADLTAAYELAVKLAGENGPEAIRYGVQLETFDQEE